MVSGGVLALWRARPDAAAKFDAVRMVDAGGSLVNPLREVFVP